MLWLRKTMSGLQSPLNSPRGYHPEKSFAVQAQGLLLVICPDPAPSLGLLNLEKST